MTASRSDLHELTAAELAPLIRTGEVSPVEVVEALLARAEAIDGQVQAWERLDSERALAAAKIAERAVADGVEQLGALHGVPFGAKDIFDTAGLRTAASFGPFDQRVPAEDAEIIARLKESGAILLGKTVTTQFAHSDPSRTRNPWSAAHTPGGSSSGSGAGVAARMMPFALGTQTAGSVLRPAAYNGVVGFKPTFGRISTRGVLPLSGSLDTVGVLARSVADCALFLQAAAGADAEAHARQPRIGLLSTGLELAAPGVRAHTEDVAKRLAAAGAEVRLVGEGLSLDAGLAVHQAIMQTEAAATHSASLDEHGDAYAPLLRAYIMAGRLLTQADYEQALVRRESVRQAFGEVMRGSGIDILLLPTAIDVAPTPETTGDKTLQAVITLLGLPAITLPSGLSPEGLPFAIQLVGYQGADAALLQAALWVEGQLDRMPAPPL